MTRRTGRLGETSRRATPPADQDFVDFEAGPKNSSYR